MGISLNILWKRWGATYVRNGELASDNYSVVPFNYGYTKKLVYSDAEKSSQKENPSCGIAM